VALIVWLTIFIGAFALGYPIAFAMFISSTLYLLIEGLNPALLLDNMVITFENQFILLAIPLFIFAARVMNEGKITDRIFDFTNSVVGPVKGGLGYVNIIASIIFAGMTGSQVADVAGLGVVEVKAMVDSGYDKPFACAVTCASATIGPIIPPSIPMIIYSMLSGTSVGYLFLGGVIPGILLGGLLMVLVYILSIKRNYPSKKVVSFAEFLDSLRRGFLPLMAPVILLGGIYGGIFTPTEAAAIAATYALILSLIVYKSFGIKKLYEIIIDVALSSAVIGFIMAAAFIFSYVIAREEIPVMITKGLLNLGIMSNKWMVLLIFNVLFLLLGCFISTTALLVVIVPLAIPIVQAMGIDLVHFGVVIVLNLMIGLDTPPYGMSLYIISGVTNTSFSKICKEMVLFILFEIIVLLICTYVPEVVLFLPRLLGYMG